MAFSWETNNRTNGVSSPKTSADFSWQKPERVITPQSASLQAQAQIAKNESDRVSGFGGIVRQTLKEIWNMTPSAAPKSFDLNKAAQLASEGQAATIKDAGIRLNNAVTTIKDEHASLLQKGTAVGEAGMGAVNSLFTIVTAPLAVISSVPGVGYLADGVNKAFGLLGAGGSIAADKAVDVIPGLSPAQRETIRPLAKEVGALSAMIIGGKAGGDVYTKLVEKSNAMVTEVAKTVPVTSETGARTVDLNTSKNRLNDYLKKQGYEPIVPDSQLPVIDMGAKATGGLPTIQTDIPASTKLGSMTVEPIKPQDFSWNANKSVETAAPSPSTVAPTTVEPILPPREPGVTKTASDINQTLVKQGFEALPTDVQAKYTPQSFKEIADHASTLLDDRLPEFKDMMTGRAPLSLEIQRNPEIYHNTLESYAIKNLTPENVQLLQDLAKSPVSQTSRAGQILGGHGFNDNPNSTVKALEGLNAEYKARVEKKTGKQYSQVEKPVIEEAKSAKDSVKVTKETWSSFVESIKCGY